MIRTMRWAAVLGMLAAAGLSGCGRDGWRKILMDGQVNDARRGSDEDGGEPAGDRLPAPKELALRRMLNGNDE